MTDTIRYEKAWKEGGHVCAVRIHPTMLHRCGYVFVANDSPLHGVKYEDGRLHDVDVHGGVTFSGELQRPEVGVGWAFGFDCAHLGDAPDVEAGKALYGDLPMFHEDWFIEFVERSAAPNWDGTPSLIWSLENVMHETRRLSRQLAAIERSAKELS